jgi:hypothetical protein
LKFVTAQLGPKPNGSASKALLLDREDLPGEGWRVLDERTWRAGTIGPSTPWGDRSRAAKNVVAWRSFEQKTVSRWLWLEVAPFVSHDDALSAVKGLSSRDFLANLRAEVVVTREQTVNDLEIPGIDAVSLIEQETSGPRGLSTAQTFLGVVNEDVIVIAFSSLDEPWSREQITAVALSQAKCLSN